MSDPLPDRSLGSLAILAPDGRIALWSEAAEGLSGWPAEEVRGRPIGEFLAGGAEALAGALEDSGWGGDVRLRIATGAERVLATRWRLARGPQGDPLAVLVEGADPSAAGEERRLRAGRVEALAALAGGITHDLNNVLSPVLMAIRLLEKDLPADTRRQVLGSLEQATRHGMELVKQILWYARTAHEPGATLQLKHLINDAVRLARTAPPESAEVHVEYPADLPPVQGDAIELHQLLLELLVARKARLGPRGRLVCRCSRRSLETPLGDLPAGPYVEVEVEWEGLAEGGEAARDVAGGHPDTVRTILRRHRGRVEQGASSLRLLLPALPEEAPAKPAAEALAPARGELVLVVEDEGAVRRVAEEALTAHGFRVLAAADGQEGLEIYRLRRGDIAAVVTDLAMPRLDGEALIREIRNLEPQARVLVMTGLPDRLPRLAALGIDSGSFLQKPFSSRELVGALQRLLR